MESFDLAFKAIAILHTVAGYIIFALAADEEMQQDCFYKDRNPLVGDVRKYLVYAGCWSLIACGFVAFIMPKLAILAAWSSIIFYLLAGLTDLVAERRWPSICKACAISLGIRSVAAAALTGLFRPGMYG